MLPLLRIAVASAMLVDAGSAHLIGEVVQARVWLYNAAGAPSTTVEFAKAECSRIFRNAGIQIEWIETSTVQPEDLKIGITAAPLDPVSPNAVGYVLRSATEASAYVIWSRVITWVGTNRPAFEILGRAMAHEIGHLLLAGAPHSAKGVMRATWSPEDLRSATAGSFFFTRKEQMGMVSHLKDQSRQFSRPSFGETAISRRHWPQN